LLREKNQLRENTTYLFRVYYAQEIESYQVAVFRVEVPFPARWVAVGFKVAQ
jgi:hypothetical protein